MRKKKTNVKKKNWPWKRKKKEKKETNVKGGEGCIGKFPSKLFLFPPFTSKFGRNYMILIMDNVTFV